jgi:hypothetical protein
MSLSTRQSSLDRRTATARCSFGGRTAGALAGSPRVPRCARGRRLSRLVVARRATGCIRIARGDKRHRRPGRTRALARFAGAGPRRRPCLAPRHPAWRSGDCGRSRRVIAAVGLGGAGRRHGHPQAPLQGRSCGLRHPLLRSEQSVREADAQASCQPRSAWRTFAFSPLREQGRLLGGLPGSVLVLAGAA